MLKNNVMALLKDILITISFLEGVCYFTFLLNTLKVFCWIQVR